jgi:hypothetical protein
VAIGDQPNIASLNRAVEKPEDVFRIPTYTELPARVPDTATKVASRAGKENQSFSQSGFFLLP